MTMQFVCRVDGAPPNVLAHTGLGRMPYPFIQHPRQTA